MKICHIEFETFITARSKIERKNSLDFASASWWIYHIRFLPSKLISIAMSEINICAQFSMQPPLPYLSRPSSNNVTPKIAIKYISFSWSGSFCRRNEMRTASGKKCTGLRHQLRTQIAADGLAAVAIGTNQNWNSSQNCLPVHSAHTCIHSDTPYIANKWGIQMCHIHDYSTKYIVFRFRVYRSSATCCR